jgi:flagellar assembly factor FliW
MTTTRETEAMPRIESTRFGAVDIDPDAVLDFPEGLIGLAGTRYALIATEPTSDFRWLHSLDDPALALPVTQPWGFYADYEVTLSDDTTAGLGLPDGVTPDVWVTVRATGDPQTCSVNLKAPILVHEGRAHQVINEAPDAPVRAPLFPVAA